MSDLHVVVLAAGKGTRMKSELPKVLHRISGLPLLDYVLRAADGLNPSSISVVVGHQANLLQEQLRDRAGIRFARQEPQLGTAHAVLQAEPALSGASGTMLLLSGDVPLLSTGTLEALLRVHHGAVCSRHGAHGHLRPTLRLRPDRPLRRGRLPESSRSGMPRPPSAPSGKSTRASMPSTSNRCSRPSEQSRRRTPRASTT